jgi:glycosyltransferase involved in cell wall biosynthesis
LGRKKYIVNAMGMHSSKYGGLERFQVSLAEELRKKDIYLIVIYNSEPCAKEFTDDLIRLEGKVIVAHAMHPFEYMITLFKLFLKYNPVLLHAHFQLYYSIIFARLFGCKRIFATLHGMKIDKNAAYISNASQIALSTRFFRNLVNRYVRRFLTVSKAVEQQYITLYPKIRNKTETIYLGSLPNNYLPEISRKKLNINSERVIIGTIGFNAPIKGLDILMNAMIILKNDFRCNDFIVYHIGIDPSDQTNTDCINEFKLNGLNDNIYWMGIRNDVSELLPGMNIYCQPSRSEALPLAIMEAGMAGVPVIGSRVGGIPEIVLEGFNGFLFESGNAYQLAECLFKLVTDTELRIKMGENSKKFIMANFNIQKQAEVICNKYLSELNLR